MDVYDLSDSDLRNMLIERGVDVGPILDSTRKVYQRKLQRVLAAEGGSDGVVAQQLEETYGEAEEEEDYDDGDYDPANADTQPIEIIDPIPTGPTYRSDSPSRVQRSSPRRPAPSYVQSHGDSLHTGSSHITGEDITLTRRTLRTTTTTSSSGRSGAAQSTTQSNKPPKKRGISICVQLLIFVIVAVLIFLVIQNMEPAAKDPLKGIDV